MESDNVCAIVYVNSLEYNGKLQKVNFEFTMLIILCKNHDRIKRHDNKYDIYVVNIRYSDLKLLINVFQNNMRYDYINNKKYYENNYVNLII